MQLSLDGFNACLGSSGSVVSHGSGNAPVTTVAPRVSVVANPRVVGKPKVAPKRPDPGFYGFGIFGNLIKFPWSDGSTNKRLKGSVDVHDEL